MRPILAIALLAIVVTAGCTAPGEQQPPAETLTAESSGTTTAESVEATTTDPTETTAEVASRTTTSEFRKGDQLLSISGLNESQAEKWNASKRATFGNLSEERQQVVKQAMDCDCNVELHGEFSFTDKDRIEVVRYNGRFYFLRVTIV